MLSVKSILPTSNQPPKGVIVALHGWGANAADLAGLVPFLGLGDYQFLLPDAPFPHPYAADGKMWYDLESDQYTGIAESRQLLHDWLRSLEGETGVPLDRTFLSGFSQGGAMTLDVGLQLPLAGLLSLSGYLHPVTQPLADPAPPVLVVHGRQDTVVPLRAAHHAQQDLTQRGVSVQYEEFDMGHEIQMVVLERIKVFIEAQSAAWVG